MQAAQDPRGGAAKLDCVGRPDPWPPLAPSYSAVGAARCGRPPDAPPYNVCHCEASKKPWQSAPCAGSSGEDQLPKERIATPPAVARNDRGNRNPGAGHRLHLSLRGSRATRQSAPNRVIARRRSRRGNLRAAIDEKFQVNDTSRRLPEGELPRRGKRSHPGVRPRWGLAMTSVIWHCLHPGGHRPPLRRKSRYHP